MEEQRSILDWVQHDSGCTIVPTSKYQLDYPVSADEEGRNESEELKIQGGEDSGHDSLDMTRWVRDADEPLFHYFLDGSRRTYKVAELCYRKEYYPVFAGQVGIGCCVRENREMKRYDFWGNLVLSFPDFVKVKGASNNELLNHINSVPKLKRLGLKFDQTLFYKRNDDDRQNLAIARIQNYMTQKEQEMVADMATNSVIDRRRFLLKDGSLEYFERARQENDENELTRFRNNYQFVVGASKTFNPSLCRNEKGKVIAHEIANLPVNHRSKVCCYKHERLDFPVAVWYVRIRECKLTPSPFDGILKLQKILTHDNEPNEAGFSDTVNRITANVIKERTPVCYGSDSRWRQHLYPIFITEQYVKSQYLSSETMLSMF